MAPCDADMAAGKTDDFWQKLPTHSSVDGGLRLTVPSARVVNLLAPVNDDWPRWDKISTFGRREDRNARQNAKRAVEREESHRQEAECSEQALKPRRSERRAVEESGKVHQKPSAIKKQGGARQQAITAFMPRITKPSGDTRNLRLGGKTQMPPSTPPHTRVPASRLANNPIGAPAKPPRQAHIHTQLSTAAQAPGPVNGITDSLTNSRSGILFNASGPGRAAGAFQGKWLRKKARSGDEKMNPDPFTGPSQKHRY